MDDQLTHSLASWLASEQAQATFAWLADRDIDQINTLAQLRDNIGPHKAQAIVTQVQLRRRGLKKFAAAGSMFFTEVGLQQATDEAIAAYKAGKFPAGQSVADLCCGIGGDLIELARRANATAVDASAEHLCFAAANVQANGVKLAATQCGQAEQFDLTDFAAWHIDPDRRKDDRRSTQLENFSPSLECLTEMLKRNPNAALKLAPASSVPEIWQAEGSLEWISHRRECKQLVAWLGNLTDAPGMRKATCITASGEINSFAAELVPRGTAAEVSEYIYDPDPALVAARLVDSLAERYDLVRLSPQSQYLTGMHPIDHPLLQSFRVLEVEKIDLKRLKKLVATSGWGSLELKQRGLELSLEAMRKRIKPRGKGEGTILFSRTLEGNRALVCQRCDRA